MGETRITLLNWREEKKGNWNGFWDFYFEQRKEKWVKDKDKSKQHKTLEFSKTICNRQHNQKMEKIIAFTDSSKNIPIIFHFAIWHIRLSFSIYHSFGTSLWLLKKFFSFSFEVRFKRRALNWIVVSYTFWLHSKWSRSQQQAFWLNIDVQNFV